MSNFKKYLLVGTAVQAAIIAERKARGVIPNIEESFNELNSNVDKAMFAVGFASTLAVGAAVNIVLWPASIVWEAVMIKKGI